MDYTRLASLCRRFAAELDSREIKKGDRVLLWGENSAEWVAAFFGCVLRGVLPVPLDVTGTADFARRVSAETSPRLIVADTKKTGIEDLAAPRLPLEDLTQVLGTDECGALPDLEADDPLQIIFTSGTTAEPKGIVHTHRNVLASLIPIEQELQRYLKYEHLFHPIRFLHTLPLSHVFGQFMGLWIPPLLAAEVHFETKPIGKSLVEQIKRERISVLAAVPRVLDLMKSYLVARFPGLEQRVEAVQNRRAWQRWWHFRDVHSVFGWKFWAFVCGGSALASQSEQFWNGLGFVVVQGYGMTETTALITLNHPFRPTQGTIGQVLPGREVRLSQDGEVLVRGEIISNTTWRNGRVEQREGEWLPTGDLAEFDDAGNLRFRGRKKDVIVTAAGLNIHPEDLEAALSRQAGVKAAAVIETDAGQGPEPLAVLALQSQADGNTILDEANRELADFQRLNRWIQWPEPDLPRTSTGKILRREVARRISADGLIGSQQTSDLNLDSLGRVQLQSQIEQQYGVVLDDVALQSAKTNDDIRKLIDQKQTAPASTKPLQHVYSEWPWSWWQQATRTVFLELIALPLVKLLADPKVVSEVRDWPTTAMLIVCNHITSYDAAFVLFALPFRVRSKVAIAMSGEMLLDFRRGRNQGNWFLDLLGPPAYFLMTALFNVFPLPQVSGFRESFRHAGRAVDHGYSVLVFPEGRRSDDGTAQSFKSGAGLLWKELGTSALPVYLSGLGELKAHRGRWFRSGKIGVTVREILSLNKDRTPEQLTEALREAVFKNFL
jgi:long-chain acyl-CoA synthetase